MDSEESVKKFLDEYYLLCKKYGLEIESDFPGSLVVDVISPHVTGFVAPQSYGEFHVDKVYGAAKHDKR